MSDFRLHAQPYFILVRTQFASNLGTSVRILKNMGFDRLILIEPECEVGVEARARAMKGAELLDGARFYPSLLEARRKIPQLVAATARTGFRSKPLSCRLFTETVLPTLNDGPVGIVFGPEDNGLRRDELQLCQHRITIPAAIEFPVINLAQAVAIVAYEVYLAIG